MYEMMQEPHQFHQSIRISNTAVKAVSKSTDSLIKATRNNNKPSMVFYHTIMFEVAAVSIIMQ